MRSLESTYLDENRNPNLRYTALGERLFGPLLGNFEQIEDLSGHVLSKMRGRILGYNKFQQSLAFSNKNLAKNTLTPLLVSQLVVTLDCCKCSARAISSDLGSLSIQLKGS